MNIWCTEEDLILIRRGIKDMFHKPWKEPHTKVGNIEMLQTHPHQKKEECEDFIRVEGLFKRKLKSLSEHDCHREGYGSCEKFQKGWNEKLPRNKGNEWRWNPDLEVYAIEFTYLGDVDV